MKIEQIATIQTGLVITRKRATTKDAEKAEYKMLTLKSFDPKGILDDQSLDHFSSNEKLDDKYLTREGDVIMRLTTPFTTINIKKDQTNMLVPSNFVIIRILNKAYLPEYLSAYLNSQKIGKLFHASAVSATIPLIKTSFLKTVEVSEAPIDRQKKIIELVKLSRRQSVLIEELVLETKKLSQAYLDKAL